MRITLISGLSAAVIGLGIFASAGSAYAAGCLSPDQTQYSLIDNSKAAREGSLAADAKGFRCDTGNGAVASQLSVYKNEHRPVATVNPPTAGSDYYSLSD